MTRSIFQFLCSSKFFWESLSLSAFGSGSILLEHLGLETIDHVQNKVSFGFTLALMCISAVRSVLSPEFCQKINSLANLVSLIGTN